MTAYIFRRVMMGVLVIIIVTIILFLVMRLLPGDPLVVYLTQQEFSAAQYNPAQMEALRAKFGLDKNLFLQYIDWMGGIFQGDFGLSITTQSSVAHLITTRIPVTLHLGILAFLVGTILGIGFGIICAVRRGTWVDTVVTLVANIGITTPIFWAAILLIYLFGLQLRWLPVFGYTPPFEDFWLSTRQLIMPVFCMSLFMLASNTRLTRSSMLEVTAQDYIRTAWSKGLRERVIVIRHTIKNGLIPVIANKGFQVANILGGSVLIETVFNIPGVGRLLTTAITQHDYMIVQAGTLIVAVAVVTANILIDITYGWLDPRIRYD
ncbi:MAG TPA: ABC transporter permease [Dehalococcoidales bacterium]|nr:ABC transporter permease [Dehalococcoidales bacterium]